MGCRFVSVALVLAQLVSEVSGDFVYDDKLGSGKSPVLPLGSPERMVRSIFEITRTTSGTLGAVGGQHSQLILDFGDQEPMLAVDLHTIRDPKRPDSRLNLGAVFVLRIPYEDVKTSKKMNSAQTLTKEELKEAKAKNPSFAPKSIWRESQLSSEVSEQEIFSFLRAWHKLFAHRYGQFEFNCQVMIGVAWDYLTGGGGKIRCPNCNLFNLPSHKDLKDLGMMVWARQHALSSGQVEGWQGPGAVVDTLDMLNGTCGFRDRTLSPGIYAFPSPRSLPFTKHQLGGTGTAVFRAYTLGLHHIGSIFDLSDHPLVFCGDLSYKKRAFTAAEHSLLYKDDNNTLEAAQSTGIKVGPFTLAMDLGGSLMRLLLNLPGHVTTTATVNTGVDLLKEMDLGRRAVMQADGQVKYRGRQRFTYAVTDTRIEIATGGMLDTLKIPLGLTGLLSKKMKFDHLSKHNMHAGSRKDLRYAGELVIVNKNPEHAHDVELWTEDDEYEMVFDNGSGSYKPYWPAPQLEELLHCNLPDIPGKFSIRVMRGSFGADQATLDAYCDIWHGVDDIPETEECKKSLGFVAVQPEVHKCCGYPVKSEDNGTCVWKWPEAAAAEECIELPGHCCQESVVSQAGSCSAEVTCQAQVKKNLAKTEVFLDSVSAGVKKWWNGRRDECWARQWRTRMFECLSTHDVGKPSTRTEEWLQGLLGYFASDSSNQDRWQAYLDNLQKLGIKRLQLDHLQNGPTNLGNDEVVVQCMLPFLNNGFPYVPLSLKLWSFLKVGVYDPSEGKIFGANLHKLASQYRQYIFDELDYKGENYKTGYDGEEGCPTAMTIPRAVDEWGNAIAMPGHSQETSESFELNFTAEELAAVELTDRLGTLEVQCGAVIAGASSPFGSTLSGAMVTAVAGEGTSQMSPTETKDLVEQLVKKGGVQLRFRRGVDPSFCTGNICHDRTVIEGSGTWSRCGVFLNACGNYCCCAAGSEYSFSFLGHHCTSCRA